jgi:DNA-binding HxlR family transcriptional regulator
MPMALPRDYENQACSLARTLEVVGERWTLLIVRDAFYGVRRFSDFLVRLRIPRAVLTERLNGLVAAGVFERVGDPAGRQEYVPTEKGRALWPAIHALMSWGDEYRAPKGPRRLFVHEACGTEVDAVGWCPTCRVVVDLAALLVAPGPGLAGDEPSDAVTDALSEPHRMLEPLAIGTRR